ncbi:predicted protein [Uncinocarpus reesii 1704]|uniref:Uncharacterized protein n=1 Tax=Uncinocarpus reesii (strain UAMH 1704) TaxID=336963 RepID=C4JIE4_UNCRE|nr:uncharacterized protein UREG_01481 [Uncinocarpus reesii 1704]EEP76632.1 predicted protein [Uncinocarpus reesii 1704]
MAFLRFISRSASARLYPTTNIRSFATNPSKWNTSQPGSDTETPRKIPFSAFKRPLAKVFLGSFLTYQIIYVIWLQLECEESKAMMQREFSRLEKEARDLVAANDAKKS